MNKEKNKIKIKKHQMINSKNKTLKVILIEMMKMKIHKIMQW